MKKLPRPEGSNLAAILKLCVFLHTKFRVMGMAFAVMSHPTEESTMIPVQEEQGQVGTEN
ncbi:hypothetical protein N7509_008089 [Penicillium cosmopolitanum]|uniref:Uncharacterized protein n=1 Tax=Penicillium cosmopolitanum TaxID=1131564 RepID=A0A9X0B8Z7_9EURO|nr:uncharacterized protein N7509_008089 [Penicillium cosmopolitanum]KAJ5392599.1 hypothetical protein N7509_008089 [Penicillium cosmopolitanum]